MTFLAHIDGQRYAVADESVEFVAADILAAVRSGGDFIDVPSTNGRPVKVLITSTCTARIEQVPEAVAAVGHGHDFDEFAFYDLDV